MQWFEFDIEFDNWRNTVPLPYRSHSDCDHPLSTPARVACNKGPEALAAFMANMNPAVEAQRRADKAEYLRELRRKAKAAKNAQS